jgi:hypothetical protein
MLFAEHFSRANAVVAEVQELDKHVAVPTTAEHFAYSQECIYIHMYTCGITTIRIIVEVLGSMGLSLQGGASYSPALSMAAPMIPAAAAQTNT